MRVIYGGRQTGRTTALIEMCAEAEANGEVSYIVCRTHDQAFRIAQKAKELNLNIGFPITYSEFTERAYVGNNIDKFFIDNADSLLQYLTPSVEVAAIVVEKSEDETTN